MELFSITSLCLLLFTCILLWKSLKVKNHCPPGPSVWCFLEFPEVAKAAPYKFLVDIGEKYGGFYSLSNYVRNFLVINDWKLMKETLVAHSSMFSGRPDMFVANKMLQRKDILFIDGPLWAEKRRFTLHHLRNLGFGRTSMESVIMHEICNFLEILEENFTDKQVLINNLFFSPVMNVIWGLLAGRRYDCQDDNMKQFCSTIKTVFEMFNECVYLNFIPQLRIVPSGAAKLKKLLKYTETVKEFLGKEIELNRKSLREGGDPRCFFDIYLTEIIKEEEKLQMSDNDNDNKNVIRECYTKEDLIGISFDLLQAGIETTVSTLEWTLLYMALWPEIQIALQNELDRVIGRYRQPVFSDHANLPLLEATILEIHRFSCVIPLSGPHCSLATTKIAGYTVEKETVIIQNIWAVHNDKRLWGDPQVFRPQRFMTADGRVDKPEYLIPFSTGSRKCLGESLVRIELFLFIACLLQKFTFSYATGEPPPALAAIPSVTRPAQKFSLIIRKRSPLIS